MVVYFGTYKVSRLTICLLLIELASTQNWWNFESYINPFKLPVFTPLPNQRFTHIPEVNQYVPMPNDVVVDIPRAGMGKFIGFSTTINYGHTWSRWQPTSGRLINAFLGIPYAAPPTDGRRFRFPVPAYLDTRFPWFAKRFRSACMQPYIWLSRFIPGFTDISEDCLYLNIYYPNNTLDASNTRYPVIVHIHGGSYVYGSSHMYPGLALASKGLVVVTFNYRLGPFGFLATGDHASIGNYGLWDQLLAITWVKQNIEWFQGDPEKITLMGESAGAASVGLHLISPLTRERYLFNQAIMMSGSDLSQWAFSDPAKVRTRYYAIELAQRLNCSSVQINAINESQQYIRNVNLHRSYTNKTLKLPFGESYVKQPLTIPYSVQVDAYALIYCLRYEKTAEQINDAVLELHSLPGAPSFVWTPVVDGISGFFPRTPAKERSLGNFAKIPLLAGVVQDEGSLALEHFLYQLDQYGYTIENFTDTIVRRFIGTLLNDLNVFRHNQTAEELYTRYTWWSNLENNTARWKRTVDLVSDMEIISPLDSIVKYHSIYSPSVYFYEFSYSSPNDKQATPEIGKNPTPQNVKNIKWPNFKQPEEAYLHIELNSSIKYHYRSSDMAFWRYRFEELAEPVPASPPIYYYPLINVRLTTLVLGCLLSVALISLIIIIVLLMKRPQPKQFKSSIRHSTPGSEFHSLLKDSFSNRNVYSTKMSTIPWTQPPTTTTTSILQPLTIRPTLKPPPKLPRISSFAYLKSNDQIRQKQLSLSNSTTSCTSYHISLYSEEKFPNRLSTKQNNTNKHPLPPPVPSNRVKSASGSSNASLSLISSSSSSPTLGSSMRTSKLHSQRQIKHKHDKNRLLHGDDHDVVMNRKESKSSDRLLYTGHTMKNNSIALPTTDIHNNNYDYNPYVTDV
ncbi:neuroligin [Schistosoma bovis]|uniref:Neuroligin n=1 Tax=Schistosoma bovis TaxID=6184 RepID=A0A430Q3Z0_SCHBO|nr:neuroligin [Schistosoma bovis]